MKEKGRVKFFSIYVFAFPFMDLYKFQKVGILSQKFKFFDLIHKRNDKY